MDEIDGPIHSRAPGLGRTGCAGTEARLSLSKRGQRCHPITTSDHRASWYVLAYTADATPWAKLAACPRRTVLTICYCCYLGLLSVPILEGSGRAPETRMNHIKVPTYQLPQPSYRCGGLALLYGRLNAFAQPQAVH